MSLPATARQVIFSAQDRITIDEQEIPEIAPDDVLLRVALVGICATDLHLLAGHIGNPFPLVPGHEFVGEIAAIGSRAAHRRGLKSGDRIAVEMLLPCRGCARCREGRYNLCEQDDMAAGLERGRQYGVNIPRTVTPGLWGGYAEYLTVPAEAIVHRLPNALPWRVAVLVEPLAVAFRAIHRARLSPGDSVVIIGPGPVGILAAAAARSAGASSVIVVGTRNSRLEVARRFGVDATVNSRSEDTESAVRAALAGGLADVVIETAGVAPAQQQAVTLVRRGGRVVLAGACGANVPIRLLADEHLLTREIDILPSFLSAGGFEPAISLLARGEFPFADLVTHEFPLEKLAEAFRVIAARDENAIKAVIAPAS